MGTPHTPTRSPIISGDAHEDRLCLRRLAFHLINLTVETRIAAVRALHNTMAGFAVSEAGVQRFSSIHAERSCDDVGIGLWLKFFQSVNVNNQSLKCEGGKHNWEFLHVAEDLPHAALEPDERRSVIRALYCCFAFFGVKAKQSRTNTTDLEVLQVVMSRLYNVAQYLEQDKRDDSCLRDNTPWEERYYSAFVDDSQCSSLFLEAAKIVREYYRKRSAADSYLSSLVYNDHSLQSMLGLLQADDCESFPHSHKSTRRRFWVFRAIKQTSCFDTQTRTINLKYIMEVRIIVRGTVYDSWADWMKDFAFEEITVPVLPYKVHKGFWELWSEARDEVIGFIKSPLLKPKKNGMATAFLPNPLDDDTEISVTGHSMGASLALLVALDLDRKWEPLNKIRCITFALPGIGSDIAIMKAEQNINSDHYVSKHDQLINASHLFIKPPQVFQRLDDRDVHQDAITSNHSIQEYSRRLMVRYPNLSFYTVTEEQVWKEARLRTKVFWGIEKVMSNTLLKPKDWWNRYWYPERYAEPNHNAGRPTDRDTRFYSDD